MSKRRRTARPQRPAGAGRWEDAPADSEELEVEPWETAPRPEGEPEPDSGGGGRVAALDRWFVPIALLILLAAAAIRLPELGLNPFHHDEGVNGYFETQLFRNNVYRYDPANYHGPSLYYFALVSTLLLGLTTEAVRLVAVVAGLATITLVFALRRFLGAPAVLAAAVLLAVSPGMVYVSRYFIHEMPLVCFSLGLVVAALLYLRDARGTALVAGAAFAALIFTTKETGIITVVVLLLAGWLSGWYVNLRDPGRRNREAAARAAARRRRVRTETGAVPKSIWIDGVEYRPAAEPPAPAGRDAAIAAAVRAARGGGDDEADWAPQARGAAPTGAPVFGDGLAFRRPTGGQAIAAAAVFATIWVLLFTSFFSNFPKGLTDSVATFTIWTQTGGATQIQPFTKYFEWMAAAEAPILLLGTLGGILVALRPPDRVAVFIALWAAGVTAAYSIVGYKTPWIVINMLVPLALLAGILLREAVALVRWRSAAAVALAAGIGLSTYQAVDLNYNHYDDEVYPYVFVHTTRDALALVGDVEARATQPGTGRTTGIVLFTPDYWPLPWYFRDYPRAGFFGQPVVTAEPIVIVKLDQEAGLTAEFKAAYARQREYVLRPGVKLVLYLRRETFGLGG